MSASCHALDTSYRDLSCHNHFLALIDNFGYLSTGFCLWGVRVGHLGTGVHQGVHQGKACREYPARPPARTSAGAAQDRSGCKVGAAVTPSRLAPSAASFDRESATRASWRAFAASCHRSSLADSPGSSGSCPGGCGPAHYDLSCYYNLNGRPILRDRGHDHLSSCLSCHPSLHHIT